MLMHSADTTSGMTNSGLGFEAQHLTSVSLLQSRVARPRYQISRFSENQSPHIEPDKHVDRLKMTRCGSNFDSLEGGRIFLYSCSASPGLAFVSFTTRHSFQTEESSFPSF